MQNKDEHYSIDYVVKRHLDIHHIVKTLVVRLACLGALLPICKLEMV
jgi:hypothetical protein